MTLVVSDISRHGIVMVGDSAVSTTSGVGPGAAKIQYSAAANVGFALWGDAMVDHRDADAWLADFIHNEVAGGDSVEDVGNKIVAALNPLLIATNRPWSQLVRGIHVAGYRNGLPVLFHVHCGHAHEPSLELRLYKDYPDAQNISEADFRDALQAPETYVHLRNGHHPHFAVLFDNMLRVSWQIKTATNLDFPYRDLQGRMDFYKTLVQTVSKILVAARVHIGVNETLSAVAFNANGITTDEMLPLPAPAQGGASFARY